MNATTQGIVALLRDEDGAQVVEYALIVAVVSIGLVVALGDGATGLRSSISGLVGRITTCLTAGSVCT